MCAFNKINKYLYLLGYAIHRDFNKRKQISKLYTHPIKSIRFRISNHENPMRTMNSRWYMTYAWNSIPIYRSHVIKGIVNQWNIFFGIVTKRAHSRIDWLFCIYHLIKFMNKQGMPSSVHFACFRNEKKGRRQYSNWKCHTHANDPRVFVQSY